jgi:hypothetical protein
MALPLAKKLQYYYGDTFDDYVVSYKDSAGVAISLVGYTASLKIKNAPGGTALLTLDSNVGGGLTLDGALGTITFNATPTKMKSGTLEGGKMYYYDLQVANTGDADVKTLLQGEFWVKAEIT